MTRLTALELAGFKSFADRTRFDFPAGVTAIVGPNGSGKSNVVDAIKWVLGEQSVRSLRGRDMTDVIFAGSGGRKPLNAAEVSLFFDNAAAALPVDAPQVQITRRVYRSGESEYLVNGEIARLRDIRELFSGTGAATEAYSVIEQGRVDALLVASGRDRRAVFEEAAGIARFRARRTEALKRLERAEQNRQRLADIVGEVSARLETLRHQAARARRWQTLTDRLRSLRLAAAARDLAAVDADVAVVEASLSTANDALAAAQAKAAAAAARGEEVAAELAEVDPRIADIRGRLDAERRRAAAAEAIQASLRGRRQAGHDELDRFAADLRRADREAAAARTAVTDAAVALDRTTDECRGVEERLASCERAAAGSHEEADAARRLLDERTAAVAALDRDRRRLESDLDRAAARLEEAVRIAQSWRTKLDETRLQAARLDEAAAVREGNLSSLAARLAEAEQELESLELARRDRSLAADAARGVLAGWQARLEGCRERRGFLAELASRQEGYSEAARRLLAAADPDPAVTGATSPGVAPPDPPVPGLVGPLADMVIADVTWAPLVDIVLGPLDQALVVRSLDELLAWHDAWAATESGRGILAAGGRIGFVAPPPNRAADGYDAEGAPGVVGRLDRLLGLGTPARDDAPAAAVAGILGRVWVVEELAAAAALIPTAPPATLYITRDGSAVSSDGVLDLGLPGAAAGIVARQAERRALDERIAELERTVADSAAAVAAHEGGIVELDGEIAAARGLRGQAAERLAASRAEHERTRHQCAAVAETLRSLEASLHDADRHTIQLSAARDAADDAVAVLDREAATARAAFETSRDEIATLDRSRDEVAAEIQRLRVERAAGGERLARARHELDTRTTAAASAAAAAAEARARVIEAEGRGLRLDLESLVAGEDFAAASSNAERVERELADAEDRREATAAAGREAGQKLEAARGEAEAAAATIHARELEAGEARHRRARITERIREDYAIDIEEALTGEPAPETEAIPEDRTSLEAEIEAARKKLSTMTSVNMEALAESEALAERLAGLQAQLDDVTSARQTIEQLVAKIDDESRRLLGETIETVRGHFRELFERVFGGGQADIVLEPGVDLLEASVEIVSRPPGKEPRSISLLSGGEKTMTCVALLLAIFRSRPSPFCVLDEVDAALDESNVDRFVGVLRDFLSSTQFIVVTHSKKTMAAADTLYGVTMEESGVSKRIAVRFESAAAATGTTSLRRAA